MEPPSKKSAVEAFFKDFVPQLAGCRVEDDPTLDLNIMFMEPEEPPKSPRTVSNSKSRTTQKRDLSMDELGLIVGHLNSGGPYCDKLIGIMLRGLEKTLSGNYFRLFVEYGPPENWMPIVKLNDDNAPFVEFLIKSDLSDQDPFSQLNDYSPEHMALCKFVLSRLHERAARRKQPAVTSGSSSKQHQRRQSDSHPQHQRPQPRAVCGGPSSSSKATAAKQACHSLSVPPKPKLPTDKENQRKSLPVPMKCSTPIAQRHRQAPSTAVAAPPPSAASSVSKRSQQASIPSTSLNDSLNVSKRMLPSRACKSNSTEGSYSKFFNK